MGFDIAEMMGTGWRVSHRWWILLAGSMGDYRSCEFDLPCEMIINVVPEVDFHDSTSVTGVFDGVSQQYISVNKTSD